MLGTAARSSVIKDKGVPIRGGAISEMKMAIPKLMGTPMAIAIADSKEFQLCMEKHQMLLYLQRHSN